MISVELGASIFMKSNRLLYEWANEFGLPLDDDPSDSKLERNLKKSGGGVKQQQSGRAQESDNEEEGSEGTASSNAGSDTVRLGLWDGERFVFTTTGSTWWDTAMGFWRYGFSPVRAANLAKVAADRFYKNYDVGVGPFESMAEWMNSLELEEFLGLTAEEFFEKMGVGVRYRQEIIEAITRVNYAQNLNSMNALSALVCLIALNGEAHQVQGGNARIFQELITRSKGLNLKLNTAVNSVTKIDVDAGTSHPVERTEAKLFVNTVPAALGRGEEYVVKKGGASQVSQRTPKYKLVLEDGSSEEYDTIILAVPLPKSDIKFENMPDPRVSVSYIHLHVTIIIGEVDPTFFGLSKDSQVPTDIITLYRPQPRRPPKSPRPPSTQNPHGNDEDEEEETQLFNSLSIIQRLDDGRRIHKIFSRQPMTDEILGRIFKRKNFDVVVRKEWFSYPVLKPVTANASATANTDDAQSDTEQLEPLGKQSSIRVTGRHHLSSDRKRSTTATNSGALNKIPSLELAPNLFYVNSFESVFSTMESEAIAGRNAARVVARRLMCSNSGGKGGDSTDSRRVKVKAKL
ncbi:hypothetical protein HK102_007892 [Quaeritorhiza haematococci]|nr:hypothetical protein HK102_007892 [Quaeritorhiza haematococci]